MGTSMGHGQRTLGIRKQSEPRLNAKFTIRVMYMFSYDHVMSVGNCQKSLMTFENSPFVCAVLALDSWNYCSGEQARQPNIRKIPESSLYS